MWTTRLAWELFAVKYVFSGSESLSLPTDVIARGSDQDGDVYLHRLEDPRPFAQLYYEAASWSTATNGRLNLWMTRASMSAIKSFCSVRPTL